MSIGMQNQINALLARVESLEKLARNAHMPENLATKDDLDALLARIRALEAKVKK